MLREEAFLDGPGDPGVDVHVAQSCLEHFILVSEVLVLPNERVHLGEMEAASLSVRVLVHIALLNHFSTFEVPIFIVLLL